MSCLQLTCPASQLIGVKNTLRAIFADSWATGRERLHYINVFCVARLVGNRYRRKNSRHVLSHLEVGWQFHCKLICSSGTPKN
jgi:hypothetical protein